LDDVIAEIYSLAKQGVREVNLLGQNVNSYQGLMHDDQIADLATLIYYVAAVEGIDRIRFTTSHPVEFNDSLIQAYADNPELANYLHLPVQSGADRILSLMKRGHTAIEYKQKIRKLRKVRPDISISSDFIVGFPGETEDDFAKTMELITDVGFDQSFSFIYSRRPGTPASNIKDDVEVQVKKERLSMLQEQITSQAFAISQSMIGSHQKVLVERHSKKNSSELSGRTENMRWVNFIANKSCIGQFVDVVITEALPNSLRGRLL
jgi:tRNA-2-methylthio-N6-dimethylallyladenosine synthase